MSQCKYTTGWNRFVTHTGTITQVEQSIINLRNSQNYDASVVSRQLAPMVIILLLSLCLILVCLLQKQ